MKGVREERIADNIRERRATRAPVYHVTSTLQLPWIVESGELRPYPNTLIGIGRTAFLWGTTKRAGDKTAFAARMAEEREVAWREDLFRLVRFTLPAECFFTWSEIVREEGWTDDEVAKLVASDREHYGEDGQDQWRCRADPLRLGDVLKVEARTYAGRWQPIELDPGRVIRIEGDPDCMGYRLNRRTTLFAIRKMFKREYVYQPAHKDSDEMADERQAKRIREEYPELVGIFDTVIGR